MRVGSVLRRIFIMFSTFFLLSSSQSFALSNKELKCYARALEAFSKISLSSREGALMFKDLYFHLISARKMSACQALMNLQKIVNEAKKIEQEEQKQKYALKLTKSQLLNLKGALELYKLHNSMYPTTAQGLKALVKKTTIPPIPSSWKGPYIEKVPKDGWGNNFIYTSDGKHFRIISPGPDGKVGTADDWEIRSDN